MRTARQLADLVREAQSDTWESTAFADPLEEQATMELASADGLTGPALDAMTRRVSAILLGQRTAFADASAGGG